ncbi:o-succinylbenzoate--CoA ligase [Corynebacterium frankenforstense]|uniref:o-succinylbenzoate--CoA ligase n=1 Tax=Corynebacterium frankenforstense TaxID=1230998 RepID=UPI00254A085C|nr:o-succinylbenzoate--CoA ligase [Corynebacterium frankenforstense]MDK6259846.1 o-succinylbenzoate--CoA ligase [Corynebacterium frankenforstense]
MALRNLDVLPVDAHDPAAILPDLEQAISGGVSLLPVPADDPGRAELLRSSQGAGRPIDPAVALVVGTSGSTGTPKGAQLTPANLVAGADATHRVLGGEGQWLLAMPAHYIAGLQVLVRALVAGVDPYCLDLSRGFDVSAFARGAAELAATGDRVYTSLTPMQLMKAMDTLEGIDALRTFDAVLVGGAALDPDTRAAAGRLNIHVVATYGASETSGGCIYDGRPIPGARVKLDASGRIHLGGATIAHGYRNRPGHESFAEEGWWATSDAGAFDAEGRLVVKGRLDAVIDTGGLKLHPEVVETELLRVPGVDAACVAGVAHPRQGQAAVAAYTGTASPAEIYEALAELPRWQWPKELRRVAALPLTATGKVDRPAVAALFS